ncbi:MAG: DNA-directed RNA polymerase subunit omega [Cardiobacteriaceae bacterium]|nr:DNA-directed RNA polymerase subunit omega [Cardiobacteriaceae bacterium]
MARMTVEDCLKEENNRFRLVLASAWRARNISRGDAPLVNANGDKPTVIALREIEDGKTSIAELIDKSYEK